MREQDATFIKWLEQHEAWYKAQSTWWGWLRNFLIVLSLFGSIASIIVAAFISPEFFSTTGRWLLVGAGALTAISSEVFSQLRVREMEALREDGNIKVAEIVAYAHQRFEEFENDPKQISQLKDELREKMGRLEHSQHRRHVAIDSRREQEIDKKDSN